MGGLNQLAFKFKSVVVVFAYGLWPSLPETHLQLLNWILVQTGWGACFSFLLLSTSMCHAQGTQEAHMSLAQHVLSYAYSWVSSNKYYRNCFQVSMDRTEAVSILCKYPGSRCPNAEEEKESWNELQCSSLNIQQLCREVEMPDPALQWGKCIAFCLPAQRRWITAYLLFPS